MHGSQRQTIWTKDPGQPGGRPQTEHVAKETFVQLTPAETMTKAFALRGISSIGMQDKEDRSAKRQEELARESGASLNVPTEPPPPQSGSSGYVTAHERERERVGGLGAALTEKEREKRIAEERQRRLDERQSQQLDQMQQGMIFKRMMNQMMMTWGMGDMGGIESYDDRWRDGDEPNAEWLWRYDGRMV
jgi:CCR4-NOT transcriptional complex subunit CAF120